MKLLTFVGGLLKAAFVIAICLGFLYILKPVTMLLCVALLLMLLGVE